MCCPIQQCCLSAVKKEVPNNWTEAVVPIFKNGGVEDPENCWLIKLISVSKTIMEPVLLESFSTAGKMMKNNQERVMRAHHA